MLLALPAAEKEKEKEKGKEKGKRIGKGKGKKEKFCGSQNFILPNISVVFPNILWDKYHQIPILLMVVLCSTTLHWFKINFHFQMKVPL